MPTDVKCQIASTDTYILFTAVKLTALESSFMKLDFIYGRSNGSTAVAMDLRPQLFKGHISFILRFIKIDNNFQLDIINDEQVLEKLHKMYPGKIEYIVHRQAEDVAEGLEKYANEANADLIVLFTTKRNIIEKLFHKSVTKDLVLHSKKPLLIYHY